MEKNYDNYEISIADIRDLSLMRQFLMNTSLKGLVDDGLYIEPVGINAHPCYSFDLYRDAIGRYRWVVTTVNGYDYLPDDLDREEEFLQGVENEAVLRLCFYSLDAVSMAVDMLSLADEGQYREMFA